MTASYHSPQFGERVYLLAMVCTPSRNASQAFWKSSPSSTQNVSKSSVVRGAASKKHQVGVSRSGSRRTGFVMPWLCNAAPNYLLRAYYSMTTERPSHEPVRGDCSEHPRAAPSEIRSKKSSNDSCIRSFIMEASVRRKYCNRC
jgi:hypothetical protein